jgi:hypothetical protein
LAHHHKCSKCGQQMIKEIGNRFLQQYICPGCGELLKFGKNREKKVYQEIFTDGQFNGRVSNIGQGMGNV